MLVSLLLACIPIAPIEARNVLPEKGDEIMGGPGSGPRKGQRTLDRRQFRYRQNGERRAVFGSASHQYGPMRTAETKSMVHSLHAIAVRRVSGTGAGAKYGIWHKIK